MQIYTWDKAGFEKAYWKQYYKQRGCGAARAHNCKCSEVDISYSRQFFEDDNLFKVRATNLVKKLSLEPGNDIFVMGCALGLLMEQLRSLGMNVYGCDNSRYIQTIKGRERAISSIHDIDVTSPAFKTQAQNATGSLWFDAVVTEDLLTSHDTFTQILINAESILNPSSPKTHVAHIVDTHATYPFTSKSLEEWKQLNVDHTWLDINGE